MKKHLNTTNKFKHLILGLICLTFSSNIFAQELPLPYEIINSTEFADDEIFVALVGKIDDGDDVWMDLTSSALNYMSVDDNTVQGPAYNGNNGPGGDAKYADCFTKLSEIPDFTIDMPQIYAVRLFFAFEEQLYLYFFGDDGGYSAPSLSNDSDPNLGIRYELVELTYGDNGLWTNTTRVDAYQYPMGIEVWGSDGFYKKVGEILTHEEILARWKSETSSTFSSCYDSDLEIILNPSKADDFQEGETSFDYFDDYVEAVWTKYESQDLILSIGEAGSWVGRVNSSDQFVFTKDDGTIGMISAAPNTLEIMEGSGVLAEDVSSTSDVDADKNIQKHFCAAFNRGAIDLDAAEGESLEWSDSDTYFKDNLYNEYVGFWHSEEISYEGETYAFCYDDVFDYSSTIQSTVPTKVVVTLGGFVNATTEGTTRIQAQDYTSMSGIDTQDTDDVDGDENVGWIDADDWMEYTITVSTAGTYTTNYRVACPSDGGDFTATFNGSTTDDITFDATGDWQIWTTVSSSVKLSAGSQTVLIKANVGEWNINWFELVLQEEEETFTPDPDKTYYIDCPSHDLRLAASGSSEDAYTTSTSTTGDDVAWTFTDKGNGYWHLDRAAGGTKPRLSTDKTSSADMQETSSSGSYTYYEMTTGASSGTYYFTLVDEPSSYNRLQINSSGSVQMVASASNATTSESFTITEIVENEECTVTGATGDYTAKISDDASNPTIQFIPVSSGTGSTTCILYYGTSESGVLGGHSVSPNEEFEISASNGEEIYFYYTYSLSSGGENNTSSSRNSFTVGDCTTLKSSQGTSKTEVAKINTAVYPNPVAETLTIKLDADSYNTIRMVDISGKQIYSTVATDNTHEISMNAIAKGVYFLVLTGNDTLEAIRVIKE